MAFKNIAEKIAEAVQEGADQTVAKAGGGAELPAEGPCSLRLVGYIELGKHKKTFQGKPKTVEEVTLIFEVSGKNHPPIQTDNGVFPHRIEVTETLSLNDKARFFKLFQLLNYKGTAKHAAELVLNTAAYRARIIHREYTGRDQKVRKVAEIFDKKAGAYTIQPPRVEVTDEDGQPTGEYREVKVAPALSEQRIFLWNKADMEQWTSLFIGGEYEERRNEKGEVTAPAKSKNKYQLKIRAAENYAGSPIQQLLANGGQELDLPADGVVDDAGEEEEAQESPAKAAPAKPAASAAKPRTAAKKADPLAGIADDTDA